MCNCDYCNESEEENSFWGDVCYYMQEHSCSEDEAIKIIREIYFKEKQKKGD
jgi:hypothetical protein